MYISYKVKLKGGITMKWRVKRKVLNEENVFHYSSRKVIIESTVELDEEQLAKIYTIVKEEKYKTGTIAKRIVNEVGDPIKAVGCGFVGTIITKTYLDINTRYLLLFI